MATSGRHSPNELRQKVAGDAWPSTIPVNVVGIANGGQIITSSDGLTWKSRVSPTRQTLTQVIYGNGQYVAVGAAGTILTSIDGRFWYPQNSGTTEYLNSVTWWSDLNLFIAVGANNTAVTSPDGANWTVRSTPGQTGLFLTNVVAASGYAVVAVAGQNRNPNMFYTTDGITFVGQYVAQWSTQYSDTLGLAYSPVLGAVVSAGSDFSIRYAQGTSIPPSWSTGGSVATHWCLNVLYIPPAQRFVVSQYVNYYSYTVSTNLSASLTTQTLPESTGMGRGAWAGSIGLALTPTGSAGRYYTSTDGITWTARQSNLTTSLTGFAGIP